MIDLATTPILSQESFKYSPTWLKKLSGQASPSFNQVLSQMDQISWSTPFVSLSDCWLCFQNETLDAGFKMQWLDSAQFFDQPHSKLPTLLVEQAQLSFDHGYCLEVLPFEKKKLYLGLQECQKFIGLEIILNPNSELELVIDYQGLDQAQQFFSQFIKIQLQKNSRLQLVERRVRTPVSRAQRILQVAVHEQACFNHYLETVQSHHHYWRNQIVVDLLSTQAQARLWGAFDMLDQSVVETESWVQHLQASTISDQLYKTVAHQESSHVFLGHVYMAPHCEGSAAAQMSKALLLSNQADLKYKPYLDIHCDDVKATHGTAISAMQPDEMFYLMARGLKPELAKQLLQYAFLDEVKYHDVQ